MNVEDNNKGVEEFDLIFQDKPNNKEVFLYRPQGHNKRGYLELVLNLFEKSPEIGRLLVRLHDRNKLYAMAKTPDEDSRSELTQTVVDLLSFDLTPAEDELIAEVLMSLIKQAERDLRRAIAERIAVMTDVPLRIVLNIANDEIFVADPVLRKSRDLKDFDLIYIIKAQGKNHWRAIATRPQISGQVVNHLVDTNDLNTAINLANNRSIVISEYAFEKLFTMARHSEDLAEPLLTREGVPNDLATSIYEYVGDSLKKFITNNYKIEPQSLNKIIDSVVGEFSNVKNNEYTPSKDIINHAELALSQNTITPLGMVDLLRRGQVPSFIAQFSVYCGLPINTVEEIIRQKTAQTMAIVCKATLIPKSEFVNMFLLTSRVRGARIIEQSDLTRAIAYYDKISEEMAKELLSKKRH